MEINKILHILRNPYDHTQIEKRLAALAAADEIERQRREFENIRNYSEEWIRRCNVYPKQS